MAAGDLKPCLFDIHRYCVVEKRLRENGIRTDGWGSADWIKLYCAMCVKARYANAKWKTVKGYSVVNTL